MANRDALIKQFVRKHGSPPPERDKRAVEKARKTYRAKGFPRKG
jgi:hypothetical protein